VLYINSRNTAFMADSGTYTYREINKRNQKKIKNDNLIHIVQRDSNQHSYLLLRITETINWCFKQIKTRG
jgi:hypothetical protein